MANLTAYKKETVIVFNEDHFPRAALGKLRKAARKRTVRRIHDRCPFRFVKENNRFSFIIGQIRHWSSSFLSSFFITSRAL